MSDVLNSPVVRVFGHPLCPALPERVRAAGAELLPAAQGTHLALVGSGLGVLLAVLSAVGHLWLVAGGLLLLAALAGVGAVVWRAAVDRRAREAALRACGRALSEPMTVGAVLGYQPEADLPDVREAACGALPTGLGGARLRHVFTFDGGGRQVVVAEASGATNRQSAQPLEGRAVVIAGRLPAQPRGRVVFDPRAKSLKAGLANAALTWVKRKATGRQDVSDRFGPLGDDYAVLADHPDDAAFARAVGLPTVLDQLSLSVTREVSETSPTLRALVPTAAADKLRLGAPNDYEATVLGSIAGVWVVLVLPGHALAATPVALAQGQAAEVWTSDFLNGLQHAIDLGLRASGPAAESAVDRTAAAAQSPPT